jgi:anti-sigma factor RsiW
MSVHEFDISLLGPYSLGVLDADETRFVDEHLATCASCRAELADLNDMTQLLGEVPPEAFLDGPPEDGDLLLQRTLRQVRAERAEPAPAPVTELPAPVRTSGRWRPMLVAAALALIVGAVGGVLISRQTTDPVADPGVTPTTAVPGEKTAKATDQSTGTTMAATVTPKAGWVAVKVKVDNLPVGAQCELRVVDANGRSFVAGSWLVSQKGSQEGHVIDGAALVPIDKVKSVDVVTFQGKRMVSVPV